MHFILCPGVDSSGQQVVIIRSNAPTTTTTTTTYASTEGEDTPLVDTDSTSQPQTRESENTPQGGLAALVDAALSSQKIVKSSLELTQEVDEGGETDEGGEEMTSDDPDWKGSVIKREASPRKRRPKRRRGDDPDLEQLEESIQVSHEFCLFSGFTLFFVLLVCVWGVSEKTYTSPQPLHRDCVNVSISGAGIAQWSEH